MDYKDHLEKLDMLPLMYILEIYKSKKGWVWGGGGGARLPQKYKATHSDRAALT